MRWFRRRYHHLMFYACFACGLACVVAGNLRDTPALFAWAAFCLTAAWLQMKFGRWCTRRVNCRLCLPEDEQRQS